MDSDGDRISLAWAYSQGCEGRDEGQDNPLARATRRLMSEGQPFSRLNMSFFDSGEGHIRWLGVFVHSAGDRILFFPGWERLPHGVRGFVGSSPHSEAPFECDHVTLEKDWRTWHVTSAGRADRVNVPRTLDVGQSRVLWFGMSVASADVLRLVCRETVATATTPPSDSDRRMEVFGSSREGAEFNLISANTDGPRVPQSHFLHFSFVIGPQGFEDYQGQQLGFPHGSPFLRAPLPDTMSDVRLRSHRVRLSQRADIQIIVSQLPGALIVPMSFTTPVHG